MIVPARTLVGLFVGLCALVPCGAGAQGANGGIVAAGAPHGTAASVPPLALRSLRGDTVRIGRGSPPTLVAVFASWCRSCKEEVAVFNRLQRELGTLGVRVIALNADEGSGERLGAWLARYGAQYPVVRDTTGAALRALGVVGVPEAYLIEADGRVAWRGRGPIEPGLASLRQAVGKAVRQAVRKPAGNPARD